MRGTGYTTSHASWERQDSRRLTSFPIDHSARPWGSDGGGSAAGALPPPDLTLYLKRYAGGSDGLPRDSNGVTGRGIGAWGEAIGMNVEALRRWYSQQSEQHRAAWDGEPTVEEVYDAAFSQPRLGSFYRSPPPVDEEDDEPDPPPPPDDDEEEPPVTNLSPLPQRVAELESLIDATHQRFLALAKSRTGRVRHWMLEIISSLLDAARETGLLRLALEQAVRAKRKLHGEAA